MADDEDEEMVRMYEEGHWIWDDNTEQLTFISDRPPEEDYEIQFIHKAPTSAMQFRDDIDVIEQMRYRRRYVRKLNPGEPDVVTVQDIKDLAIYTAPVGILSPALIKILHLSTTERFIRALIFYMQYYLQASDEMIQRELALEAKLRTPQCDVYEEELRDNLNDLRVLVAKEYCTIILGGADTKKYHHMGPTKGRRSLSDKDARQFETLLRMCVQIVWLALGRTAFNQLELEMNRLFKSEMFNAVEHRLKTNYYAKMSKEETDVLVGGCVKGGGLLGTRSPLMNEVACHRKIDYRLLGLGVIKLERANQRLRYMYEVIAAPEDKLSELGLTLGIIGLPRTSFDTMFKPLPFKATSTSKKSSASISRASFREKSTTGSKSTIDGLWRKPYPDIRLPPKSDYDEYYAPTFPTETEPQRACSETQRKRWLNRLERLRHPHLWKRK